jgi:putative ABC transport system permease protein
VINLLLARGVQRRGEFALRAALGAGRGRLVRQLLTESLLLSLVGGIIGFGVAAAGVRTLVALTPPGLAQASTTFVAGTMFAFGLGITTLIGLTLGVLPALQAANNDPHGELQRGSRRSSRGHGRTRSALVIAEVAVALVLLAASGLLLRSLERLFAVPVGFDAAQMITMQVQETGKRFDRAQGESTPGPSDTARYEFFAQALDAVRHVNGVRAVAMTSQLPLSGDMDQYGAQFLATPTQGEGRMEVFRYATSPGYAETMHIPLRQGRMLNDDDRAGAPPVALISESLARARFHGESPIGARMRVSGQGAPFTIVGVVGDIKQASLALSQSEAVYVTTTQWHWVDRTMSIVVRTRGDAAALVPAIRSAVWSVDRNQPIVRVATMEGLLATSAAERRFALVLFEAFALAALVLAAAGIYGVLAGTVVERTREIGVRAALGATPGSIVAMVARQGLRLTILGAVFGLVGATVASKAIVSLLFGVSRLDPATYLGVVALLMLVSAVASAFPAWRAARVDPVVTLRAE